MKKILALFITLVLVVSMFCSCGNSTPSEEPVEEPVAEIDISIFDEVDASYENLDVYRQEVSKRLNSLEEGNYFISDEEWTAIESNWDEDLHKNTISFTSSNGYEAYDYYYPIVWRDENSLILWYTTENGYVILKRLCGTWNDSNSVGSLHLQTEEKTIYSQQDYSLSYNQETGRVTKWLFGKENFSYALPKGSEFCGFSNFEGYIFRDGTDVYALRLRKNQNSEEEAEIVCIAHNVQYVIEADYHFGSDPWSQPLFQMTDGSIKAYIGWEGNEDIPDSETHLLAPRYEGGYK